MSIEIIFETHSLSIDNERGIATGWLDGSLSETGKRLAKELGQRRRAEGFDRVFTSDLQRAVETVEVAFAGSGVPVQRDARLREVNYGMLNGMPVSQLEAEKSRHIDEPFPGGESYRQVVERVQSFLDDLAREWDGKHVLIIGHAATRFALDYLLNRIALEELVAAPFNWREGWRYIYRSGDRSQP